MNRLVLLLSLLVASFVVLMQIPLPGATGWTEMEPVYYNR